MPLSRFSTRLPFTTVAEFVVARPFDLNGKSLVPGVPMPRDGIDDRLLKNLYDQRKIEIGAQAAADVPTNEPAVEKKAADKPATVGKYRVKQAGIGGFKVLDEAGAPIGPGFKTHAEALAEAERLNAA
jgi:hypothetical protein